MLSPMIPIVRLFTHVLVSQDDKVKVPKNTVVVVEAEAKRRELEYPQSVFVT